jgi:hypothetical protein
MLFQATLANGELQSEERIQEIIAQIDTDVKPLKFLSSNFILQKIHQKQTNLLVSSVQINTIYIYLKKRRINVIFS